MNHPSIRGLDVLATHFRFAMTLRTCDCWKMVWHGVTLMFDEKNATFQTLDQVNDFFDVWWCLMGKAGYHEAASNGRKEIQSGGRSESQVANAQMVWLVCFVRTIWCNVFAVFANNEQTKCFFIYCSFLKRRWSGYFPPRMSNLFVQILLKYTI